MNKSSVEESVVTTASEPVQQEISIPETETLTCNFLNGNWKVQPTGDNISIEEEWRFRCFGTEDELTGARRVLVEPVGVSLVLRNDVGIGGIQGKLLGIASFEFQSLHYRYSLVITKKGDVLEAVLGGSPSGISSNDRALKPSSFLLTRR